MKFRLALDFCFLFSNKFQKSAWSSTGVSNDNYLLGVYYVSGTIYPQQKPYQVRTSVISP